MNRTITYQAGMPTVGNYAGKIVVTKQDGRSVRFSVGDLTRSRCGPSVRTWGNTTGRGLAVDLWIDEAETRADHWPAAEAAIRARFPDHEIVYCT